MRRIVRWTLAVLMLVALLTACGLPGPKAVTYTAYDLTCCTKGDIVGLWQPGTTVELHWIVESASRTTLNPTHKVIVTASLWGPYSDTRLVQANGTAIQSIQGSVTMMDDRRPPSTAAVTTFQLPADVPSGWYKLNFHTEFGDGSSADGTSVVRIGTQ